MPIDDRHIDDLDDALDRVVSGERGPAGIPSTTADLIGTHRRIEALDATPGPDDDFVLQLKEQLMHTATQAMNGNARPATTKLVQQRAVFRSVALPRIGRGVRGGFAHLAAVALLVITLGIGYIAFDPFGSRLERPSSLPAAIVPAAATPTLTPFPMAGHAIIGMWQFDIETRQPGTDLAYFNFAKDGTFVGTGERGDWAAFGNWRATGARTVELFYVLQGIPNQDVFAPTFTPVGNVLDSGILTLHLSLEIDATGNTVVGEGEGTRYRNDGTVVGVFSGADAHMIGTRMELVPTDLTPTTTT